MFIEEEIIPDNRPFLAVFAPGNDFILKYFDRRFDMRITSDPEEVVGGKCAFVVINSDSIRSSEADQFIKACKDKGLRVVTLLTPPILGTGMNNILMRLARGVARGTMLKIKKNNASWSVIHATDVANAAFEIAGRDDCNDLEVTISAPPVLVNDLLDAFGQRIKNKRVGSISPKYARIIYGRSLFQTITTDNIQDCTDFTALFPDFSFANPAEYLTTHNYDDESL